MTVLMSAYLMPGVNRYIDGICYVSLKGIPYGMKKSGTAEEWLSSLQLLHGCRDESLFYMKRIIT